jgi:hypothetical protein
MLSFLKLVIISTSAELKEMLQARVQCPFLTFNKMCFGYLNSDWVMVLSNAAILMLSVSFLLASGVHGKGISG